MASEEDSYSTLTLKGTPVADLKVNDIKKELDKRGLSKAGSKTQLIDRLKAQLLLEKLQHDAAQSSGDELEGKVPNMALQQEQAGQSEFVRQYLEQQQRNLERQMEVKKQVEEERKRKSADESSTDEAATPQSLGKPTADPEMTSPKKFKDDNSNAPATEELKMPRPARKSSRNASRGENGQENVGKDKSRSPSPERESLRERTRSGSSSSSRSATPEAPTRRGRPARGARGGRRGGRRGAGGRQASRKESRSSSRSSSEEEVMPKKRSRRATNSISSRSRSRSPTQMASPETTPNTRRSRRRISSATKTPTDHDVQATSQSSETQDVSKATKDVQETKAEDPAEREGISGTHKSGNIAMDVAEDVTLTESNSPLNSKTGDIKETRRSVEVLEPSAENIEKIEAANAKNVEKTKETVVEKDASHTVKDAIPQSKPYIQEDSKTDDTKDASESKTKSAGRLSRWRSSRSKEPASGKAEGQSDESQKETVPEPLIRAESEVEKAAEVAQEDVREEFEVTGSQSKDDRSPSKEERTAPSPAQEKETGTSKISGNKREGDSRPQDKEQPVEKVTSECAGEKAKEQDSSKSSAPALKRRRSRSGSSSSSSSASPPRKREAQPRSRSASLEKIEDTKQNGKAQGATGVLKGRAEIQEPEHTPMDIGDGGSTAKSETPSCSDLISSDQVPQKDQDCGTSLETDSKEKGMGSDSRVEKQAEVSGTKPAEESTPAVMDSSAKDVEEEAANKKEKATKKRKWGSKSSKNGTSAVKKPTSMEISSDSLKNLIGDVKLSETVFDMETEVVNTLDYDENEEDKRDIKVKRTVVQDSPQAQETVEETGDGEDARSVQASGDAPMDGTGDHSEQQDTHNQHKEEEEGVDNGGESQTESKKKVTKSSPAGAAVKEGKKKVKEGKKVKKKKGAAGDATEAKENKTEAKDKEVTKIVATTRPSKPLLPVVDEPEKVRSDLSPARHPPDRVLRIAGLVRPFTLGQLKELMKRTGELDEEHFWINDIKSHCLAAFKTKEDAVKTRAALHGTRWPQSNPKILIVDFATMEDLLHRKSGGEGPPPAVAKKNLEERRSQRESREEPRKEAPVRGRDDRDRAEPKDARRRQTSAERGGERRKDSEGGDRERAPPQVREWDKDKMKQLSRSRSKSKERDRPPRGSKSRDSDQRKRREGSRDKREDERKKEKKQKEAKAEEEPPAKLLDDLFRKTKATPCIYWLPLTEEQAEQRSIQRQEREKEKQKRLAEAQEREKEELKKREAARLERQKQREKEQQERMRARERSGDRDRGRGRRGDRGRPSRSRSNSGSRSRRRR